MTEQAKKNLLVVAVSAHDPNVDDDLEAAEAVFTAPDVSSQLPVKRGDKFEVLGPVFPSPGCLLDSQDLTMHHLAMFTPRPPGGTEGHFG